MILLKIIVRKAFHCFTELPSSDKEAEILVSICIKNTCNMEI